MSLATRVAQERGESFDKGKDGYADDDDGDDGNNGTVGYCVRGDVKIPRNANLVFCTVGVMLRKLLEDNIDFTHLVIDEAHERSLEIDFLLMLVKFKYLMPHLQNAKSPPRFKVIIMSATLDQSIFEMFPGGRSLEIPGRTFPVEVMY